MSAGRVLSMAEGTGHRPILSTVGLFYRTQPAATVVYGNLLMYPTTRPATHFTDFIKFMEPSIGQPLEWWQMRKIPNETMDEYFLQMRSALGPREMLVPTAKATLTLNAVGYDPGKGFWLDFNSRIPLLTQDRWWANDDE